MLCFATDFVHLNATTANGAQSSLPIRGKYWKKNENVTKTSFLISIWSLKIQSFRKKTIAIAPVFTLRRKLHLEIS